MSRRVSFQALPYTFFLSDVYRDAARQWRGAGLLYVLLLAAIVTALAMVRIELAVSNFATHQAPPIIAQLPAVTIDHGHVRLDGPNPAIIRDPPTGKVIAIIDTTAAPTLEGTTADALMTRDHIVMRKSAAETRVFELSRVQHFIFDRNIASRWLRL